MTKAEQKKRDNIAEYLVYMYQTEDLLRTYKFDLNQITKYIISSLPLPDVDKKELILWYASIIEAMQEQKIEEKGHLEEINRLFICLHKVHTELKQGDKNYVSITKRAEPFIKNQIKQSNNTLSNPIQIATNAVYGFLLLKTNRKEMTVEQQKMLDIFGDMLSYLSYKYKNKSVV